MTKINWKVRLKNKAFWLFMIPAVLLLINTVASIFGYNLDLSGVEGKLLDLVEALFVVLAGIGIVTDPTTKGLTDSTQAMNYELPKED